MNDVLREHIGKYCLVYFDDMLIYSRSPEEHLEHLKRILSSSSKHKLFAKLSKCCFALKQLQFLGHLLSADGMQLDHAKVAPVSEWPVPTSVTAIQQFMGLANYLCKFIAGFFAFAAPITDLTCPYGQQWP